MLCNIAWDLLYVQLIVVSTWVCPVFAQGRLPLIVLRGLRAPQLLGGKMAGHGDPDKSCRIPHGECQKGIGPVDLVSSVTRIWR